MGNTIAEIRKINNGFVIRADDPAIVKSNKNPKTPYKNPSCEYSFPTFEKLIKWLKDNVDNLVPGPDDAAEYANSFDKAVAEER